MASNSTTAHRLTSTGDLQFPDHITVMETEEAIHIIRKPNEKTVKKEIQPPIIKKTIPTFFLTKRAEEIDKPKIILPPSKCDLTIDERFTTILCQIQKKEIDPGLNDLQCPSTIIGKLQRVNAKAARLSTAPYSNPRTSTNPKEAKVTDRLGKFGKEEDELDWDNLMADQTPNNRGCWFFEMFNHPNNYNTGPSKSLDELDDEIEQYFNKVGGRGKRVFKRKTYEMLLAEMKARYGMEDPFFQELEAKISSLKLDNNADEETEDQDGDVVEPAVIEGTNFFQTFVKAIKSSKMRPKRDEEEALDEDLGSYWSKNESKSKQNLDDDLENYRKKDPRNLKNNNKSNRSIKTPITGPTTVTASTSSKTTGDDYMNVDGEEEDIFAEWLQ